MKYLFPGAFLFLLKVLYHLPSIWKVLGHFCDTDLWPSLLFFFYLKRLLFVHYGRLVLLGIGFCDRFFFCCCFSTLKMLLHVYWVGKSLIVYRSNWRCEPGPIANFIQKIRQFILCQLQRITWVKYTHSQGWTACGKKACFSIEAYE